MIRNNYISVGLLKCFPRKYFSHLVFFDHRKYPVRKMTNRKTMSGEMVMNLL